MQPTDESLKIIDRVLTVTHRYTLPEDIQESLALALDAAYQRGRDETQKELDAALALAAMRGEQVRQLGIAVQRLAVAREENNFELFNKISEDAFRCAESAVGTPETWLDQKLKRAKAEGVAEWLEREAERTLEEATESISLKLFYVDLQETAEKFKKAAAAIRKEAGL